MISNYFKIAFRNLRKNKVSTSINILGLTIGISTCLIIFLIANFELNHDTFHPNKERIYRVVSTTIIDGKQNDMGYVPSPLSLRLAQQVNGLETVAGFYNYYAKVGIPKTERTTLTFAMPDRDTPSPIIVAQPDYFSIFSYNWLVGDKKAALNEPFKVVISDKEAQKYFGNEPLDQLIGKEIIYNDSLHLTVAGVVKAWDKNTDFGFSQFISFATVKNSFLKNDIDLENWGSWDFYSQVFVKLKANVNPHQIEQQLSKFTQENIKTNGNMKAELKLQPLADIHFNSTFTDAYSRKASRSVLYGLMIIAGFILIIAAVNYINLSTAQTAQRAKEVGIRKVLGSSKKSLITQFLGETTLLIVIALLISLLLIWPALYLFSAFLPKGVTINLFQTNLWIFFISIFCFILLVAGLYPAISLSGGQPVLTLKGGTHNIGRNKEFYRQGLIVFQFTISLVFIIATLVVGKQIHYLLNKDMGFQKDAIINIKIPFDRNDLSTKKLLTEKLQQLPQVVQVSLHRETPVAARHGHTSIKRLNENTTEVLAAFEFTDQNYISLYEIKMLAGKTLSVSDTLKEFLVNATCAQALGFAKPSDAIGQIVETGMGGKKGPIVGVIDDFHSQSLHETIQPFFMTSNAQSSRTISVKLLKKDKEPIALDKTLAAIQSLWTQLYPDEAFTYSFFDDTLASFYTTEQKTASLINIAMDIAIFISCIGLYGMSAFIAQQRTKEIGIRKVLGATVIQITSLISQGFIKLVFIALMLSSPIAWYFTHEWLKKYPYQTSISWWIFPMAGLIAILITMIAISYQSIKAALMNPVKTLKNE